MLISACEQLADLLADHFRSLFGKSLSVYYTIFLNFSEWSEQKPVVNWSLFILSAQEL